MVCKDSILANAQERCSSSAQGGVVFINCTEEQVTNLNMFKFTL